MSSTMANAATREMTKITAQAELWEAAEEAAAAAEAVAEAEAVEEAVAEVVAAQGVAAGEAAQVLAPAVVLLRRGSKKAAVGLLKASRLQKTSRLAAVEEARRSLQASLAPMPSRAAAASLHTAGMAGCRWQMPAR